MTEHEKLPPGDAPSPEELERMFVMPFEVKPIRIEIICLEDGPTKVPIKTKDQLRPWMIIPASCSFIMGIIIALCLYNVI